MVNLEGYAMKEDTVKKIEQIKSQYANERYALSIKRERREITFGQFSSFIKQLHNAENMDIIDAMHEGENA